MRCAVSAFSGLGAEGAVGALEQMSRDKAPWISAAGRLLGQQFKHVPWALGLVFAVGLARKLYRRRIFIRV
jgi:hypothetical protein